MARKLSRRAQNRIKSDIALLEEINTLADSISEAAITDLVRRDAIGIGHDSLPANSMPEFSGGGGFGGSSTESAALHGLQPEHGGPDNWNERDAKAASADTVRVKLNFIEQCLRTARNSLKDASGEIEYLNIKTETIKGRNTSTPCDVCQVLPAQKAGWCFNDFNEWNKDGRPDRTIWVMWKRGDKNSEGLLLVPNKPKSRLKT